MPMAEGFQHVVHLRRLCAISQHPTFRNVSCRRDSALPGQGMNSGNASMSGPSGRLAVWASLAGVEIITVGVENGDRLLELQGGLRARSSACFRDVKLMVPHIDGRSQLVAVAFGKVELSARYARIVTKSKLETDGSLLPYLLGGIFDNVKVDRRRVRQLHQRHAVAVSSLFHVELPCRDGGAVLRHVGDIPRHGLTWKDHGKLVVVVAVKRRWFCLRNRGGRQEENRRGR